LSRDELEQIPLPYRIVVKVLLKLPNPRLPFFLLRKFPELEGIIWAVVAPVVVVSYAYCFALLIPFLSLHFSFPWNIVIGFLIPVIILLFFIRVQLERAIHWWRNIYQPSKEWKVSEKVEELLKDFQKQQKAKKT